MGISCNQLRFRRGFPVIRLGTARLPRQLRLLAMTNPGALCGRRYSPEICDCPWRSLTAATDAIGSCVFIDSRYELQVPTRDCHGAFGASQ